MPDQDFILQSIKLHPYNIKFYKNLSEEAQLLAVGIDGHVIMFIDNPSPQVQIAAVLQNCWSVCDIENICPEAQIVAVKQDTHTLKYIKNPSREVQKYIFENKPHDVVLLQNTTIPKIQAYKQLLF